MAKANVAEIPSTLLRTGSEPAKSNMDSTANPEAVAQRAMYSPRVIQTVATTRQVMADGEVLVTRSVTFTALDVASRSPATSRPVSDVPQPESQQDARAQQQQFIHPYAAVPVQGGWLVFQL
ncbi:MAG TPA: hypothetical protein VJU82_13510, partial [Acidobacteriaceae bacterium]|nr:hypothetical protein [Acidobacteriaceae bacterium]